MGRRPKPFRDPIHGLLVVDKPLGASSMDVVRRVRYAAGNCRTGHAGTLDPLATGVLVCCLGKGTKLVEGLMGQPKIYQATLDLGAFTITDDAEGEREEVACDEPPGAERVRAVLDELTGTIMQRPPAYSACKIDGQPAYKRARRGETVELAARPVRIDRIVIDAYAWPELRITVDCGRGTYLRSLARQIGEALGTGGHLTALRRTAVGEYRIEHALALDALPDVLTQDQLLPLPDVPREAR